MRSNLGLAITVILFLISGFGSFFVRGIADAQERAEYHMKVNNNSTSIEEIKRDIKDLSRDGSEYKSDIRVIRIEQTAIRDDFKEQQEKLDSIQKDQKDSFRLILERLSNG